MKQRLLWLLSKIAFFVLHQADRFVTGSASWLTAEEMIEDPYRHYKIIRKRGHVLRTYENRGWLALGFEEAQALFRDQRFGTDLRKNKFLSSMMRMAADGREISFLVLVGGILV